MTRTQPRLPRRSQRGPFEKLQRGKLSPLLLAAGLLVSGSAVYGQEQPPAPQGTPPQQNGPLTLPQTPPQTGLQAPVPAPALGIQTARLPLLRSPGLGTLPAEYQNRPLTLQDAVAVALSTNRQIALSVENLLRARGRVNEARANLNPTLGLGFGYTRLFNTQTLTFPGANGQAQTVQIVQPDTINLGITGTLPIDVFGILRTAVDQARFNEVATRIDINRTLNDTVLNVKTAFYDALRAEALVTVQQNNLENAQARLRDAEQRFAAGVVARFDVIRAQTDVLNAQQSLVQARYNVSLALASLNNVIGLEVTSPIRITSLQAVEQPPGVAPPTTPGPANPGGGVAADPNAAPPVPNQTPPSPDAITPNVAPGQDAAPPDRNAAANNQTPVVVEDSVTYGQEFTAVVDEALKTRPEVLQAEANVSAARRGIRLADRSLAPTFGVSLGGQYTPLAAGLAPITQQGSAVVSVNIPIFDGGVAAARRQQAQSDLANAETNRRQAVDVVTLDVRQAYLNLRQSRDRVAVANAALGQAREAFRLARVRYEAGVAAQAGVSPLLEVSDAQAALTQAEQNQVNALYDYNNARSRLDRAVGRYSYLSNGPGYTAPPSAKTVGQTPQGGRK